METKRRTLGLKSSVDDCKWIFFFLSFLKWEDKSDFSDMSSFFSWSFFVLKIYFSLDDWKLELPDLFLCLQHPLTQFFRDIKTGEGVGSTCIDWKWFHSEIFPNLFSLKQQMAGVTESHVFFIQSSIEADVLIFHICTFPFLHISIYVCDFLPYLSAIIYVKSLACNKKRLSHYRAVLLRACCVVKSPGVLFFSWPCEMMCIF